MPRTHGIYSTYTHGCRCADCRKANAEKTKRRRLERVGQGQKPAKHGETGYSNYGCRCSVCVAAWRERCRQSYEAARARVEQRMGDGAEPPAHGTSGYNYWGCRCEVCRTSARATAAKSQQRVQAQSLEQAHRYRAEWTGPELELLTRDDLTSTAVAKMIGRTVAAVRTKRHKLKTEPRDQWLAGQRSKLH